VANDLNIRNSQAMNFSMDGGTTLNAQWTTTGLRIGAATPTARLHVGAGGVGTQGEQAVIDSGSGAGGYSILTFARNAVTKSQVGVEGTAGSGITGSAVNDMLIRNSQAINFSADGGTTLHMQLAAGGFLGLGTVPATLLHIKAASPQIRVQDSSGTVAAFFANPADIAYVGVNRSSAGTYVDAAKASAAINLTGAAGNGHIEFYTTATNGGALVQAATIDNQQNTTFNGFVLPVTKNVVSVTAADFVTAANTNLQTITGLSWILPANTAANYPFRCEILYSQQAAAVAAAFGIQSATIAPTNIMAKGDIGTSASVTAYGNLPVLNSTTATTIVTFTPSAITTVWNARLAGFIENPSGVANTINIMTSTTTAADTITVKRGSYCVVGF
jgi:hypothetical protein